MNTISWDKTGTMKLSDKAMLFLQQIDAFWWEVSECVKCQTIVLDSELVGEDVEVPDCGCQNVAT